MRIVQPCYAYIYMYGLYGLFLYLTMTYQIYTYNNINNNNEIRWAGFSAWAVLLGWYDWGERKKRSSFCDIQRCVCVSKIERLDFFAMPDQDSKQYYAYTFSTLSFSVGALISARCVIHRRRGWRFTFRPFFSLLFLKHEAAALSIHILFLPLSN